MLISANINSSTLIKQKNNDHQYKTENERGQGEKVPGQNCMPAKEITGGEFIRIMGFVIVTGIRKRGPRQGALLSIP